MNPYLAEKEENRDLYLAEKEEKKEEENPYLDEKRENTIHWQRKRMKWMRVREKQIKRLKWLKINLEREK